MSAHARLESESMFLVGFLRWHLASWTMAIMVVASAASARLRAQGITTASIRGTVRASDGADPDAAHVSVINSATGYRVEAPVRHGRFLVSGLEVGGPYIVGVRRIGFPPAERSDFFLTLGQELEIDFVLDPAPPRLDTMRVVAAASHSTATRSSMGTGTTISDSLLRRMPALNRDVLDFARLVPEVGTRFGGLSGAGVGFRFNSYLIDGVSERLLLSNGTLNTIANGKPISVEAVKEYEVVLAPYDVRYGDFAGVLVNAVTMSGTNDPHGTAFLYARNESLARNTPFLRGTPYDRRQFGFTLGGPIVRDRMHYFVATELQREREPALGPYLGQGEGSTTPVPVSEADILRFASIMRGYGIDAGSGGRVVRSNPDANVFARIDLSLPALNSRAVLRENYSDASLGMFSRASASAFALTSNAWTQTISRSSTTLQLFTNFGRGALNELLVSRGTVPQGAAQYTLAPLVRVTVPRTTGGSATLVAGPPDVAQGTGTHQTLTELADHLVFRGGAAHTISIGARGEFFSVYNKATRLQFGSWTFASLDALERGDAATFRIEKDFGSATKQLRGAQVSAYLGDAWQASDRLSLTGGIRADLLEFTTRPGYDPAVDSIFGRRTSDFPRPRVEWSPRLGFRWESRADGRAELRGGAGIFVGRPPLAWIIQSQRFDGVGTRTLNCDTGASAPHFDPDARNPPGVCANGQGFVDGLVNLIDARLTMTRMFRSSLAYERALAAKLRAGGEALYTRTLADLYFANPNLAGPRSVDRHGRVLYGDINAQGGATAAIVSARFPELVDLRNHGNGHSLSLTGRLTARHSDRLGATASYTHTTVRDVQSLVGPQGQTYNAWATGRPMSGIHDDLSTGVSAYEITHRVIVAATWTAPWKRHTTEMSMYYVGESGLPFTYTDSSAGAAGRPNGDLNADGTNANDPIYVPRSAFDTSEIRFAPIVRRTGTSVDTVSVAAQQGAFEAFIGHTPCLRRQRGHILARNSCRAPWIHTVNASLRQALPLPGPNRLTLELQAFNVLNLIERRMGLVRIPSTVALQHVGQTPGPASAGQPVFGFDTRWKPYSAENAESAYQVQLALRYSF